MNTINHEYWARKIIAYIVQRIRNFQGGEKFITYGELAREIGYPEPHTGNLFGKNIGKTLGVMGHLFDNIVVDGEEVPLLQALVVNQNQKLPSDGLKEFNSTYPKLSVQKKRDFVQAEYKRIFEFGSRWEKVLEKLGILEEINVQQEANSEDSGLYNPYGSEGSPEHIALRDFVASHPEIVGLGKEYVGITEYPLKSGDSVDVVFELEDETIAIEVKSTRSGVDDIERGLFQCVKYKAVLEAEIKVNNLQKEVRSFLVIQGTLPRKLSSVRKNLGLEVVENVAPNLTLSRPTFGGG